MTLADIHRCLGSGADEGQDIRVTGVSTDSRAVNRGDLFVCIPGENFDGHGFAAQAVKMGAVGVLASQLLDDPGAPVIMVPDTVAALGRIAACHREQCGAALVAVTGSCGKTSAKELLAGVLSVKHAVAKNYKNFNNQIGLPLSMLKATVDQDVWVMEAGISRPGDMDDLGAVARPDVALITNIGPAHLEGLGDLMGVATAKASLLRWLAEDGTGVVCRDYPQLTDAALAVTDRIVWFSTRDESVDFFAEFLSAEDDGMGRFRLKTPDGEAEFNAPFHGMHWAENLAGVAAVASLLGLKLKDVVAGCAGFRADGQRFCCADRGGFTVIDDTYNANPLSMDTAIRTARQMAGDKPLVLVLADMRELGQEAAALHEDLGRTIAEVAPAALFFKGAHFADVNRGYGGQGVEITSTETFLSAWRQLGLHEGVVLFKGSRSCRMEEYAKAFNRMLDQGAAA